MGLKWFSFSLADVSEDMKHAISTRWLANPNQGANYFPLISRSSYEYTIHYQSEDSCAH